jgi:hypothetical protein
MQNYLITHPGLSDAGTVTGGTTANGLGVTNLQNPQPGSVARFTDLGDVYIEIDLGSAMAINFAGLLFGSWQSSAEFQVRGAGSPEALTTLPVYDSGTGGRATTGTPRMTTHHLLHSFTASSNRYWRIDISDAGNPDTWIDIGVLVLAIAWQVSMNPAFGAAPLGVEDPGIVDQAIGGQLWPHQRPKRRVGQFTLDHMSKDEIYNNAFPLEWDRGVTKPILVVPDLDDSAHVQRETIYGLMSGLSPAVHPDYGIWQKRIAIREMIA